LKLYVGNLGFDTQEDELRAAFAAHGEVASVAVITDRVTGRPRGFGFVEMPNQPEAQAAMRALDASMLGGRTLTVNEARDRGASPSSGRPTAFGRR
jgi:RNA recognition motif-containing protein